MTRDPRIRPKPGDVPDDEKTGMRYIVNAVRADVVELFEFGFYDVIETPSWRAWSKRLRPVCLRMITLRPSSIAHGRKVKP